VFRILLLLCHDSPDFTKRLTSYINASFFEPPPHLKTHGKSWHAEYTASCACPPRNCSYLLFDPHHHQRDDHGAFRWLSLPCRDAMSDCAALSPQLQLVRLALLDQTLGNRANKGKGGGGKPWELIGVWHGLRQQLARLRGDEVDHMMDDDKTPWTRMGFQQIALEHAALLRLLRNVLVHSDVDGTKESLQALMEKDDCWQFVSKCNRGSKTLPEGFFSWDTILKRLEDSAKNHPGQLQSDVWLDIWEELQTAQIGYKRQWVGLQYLCNLLQAGADPVAVPLHVQTTFLDWLYNTTRDNHDLTTDEIKQRFDDWQFDIADVIPRFKDDPECSGDDFFIHHRRSCWYTRVHAHAHSRTHMHARTCGRTHTRTHARTGWSRICSSDLNTRLLMTSTRCSLRLSVACSSSNVRTS
jgi:hypothetical protein